MTDKKVFIGGQAIIEGVMMKGPEAIAFAARKGKKIVSVRMPHVSVTKKNALLRLPIIRGVVFLAEMLVIGLKALSWSANQQGEGDEQLSKTEMTVTMIFSFVLAIGLFVVLPYYLTRLVTQNHSFQFNLIDGFLRLLFFVGYLVVISLMKEVRCLFQYHGAEHKAVHCYEADLPLTVKNVQKFSTLHPRCGTSLVVFVIAVSIVVFSLIRLDAWYWNVLMRIVVIPLIAGVSYELLKFTGTSKNSFLRLFAWPGMWVQKLTTRKPTDAQVEVAIVALKKAL